jgi:hypothetical protein
VNVFLAYGQQLLLCCWGGEGDPFPGSLVVHRRGGVVECWCEVVQEDSQWRELVDVLRCILRSGHFCQ